MHVNITFEEFRKLKKIHNVIPVWAEAMADMDTPISVFKKIQRKHNVNFLLESIEGGELLAKYSFLGFDPVAVIEGNEGIVSVSQFGKIIKDAYTDPLIYLKNFLKTYNSMSYEDMPPLTGGLVGFMSYDCIKYFEPLKIKNPKDIDTPEFLFFFAGKVIVFDHQRHSIKIVINVLSGNGAETEYNKALAEIKSIYELINQPLEVSEMHPSPKGNVLLSGPASNMSQQEFEDMVRKAKEYILDGDIFQVVLSQRFELPLDADTQPLDIYRALRRINPSPYMYFLNYGDLSIVGSSPEPLVKVDGRKVLTRPIAGTRKRGKTEHEDIELENELLSDKKELAEHIMLVDLGRNDLGRVCKPGTVYPDKLMFIERFSHVMHIVTNLRGELEEDKDAFDALRAVFPAGTVSGAPKIRAMEIIDELENVSRGPYAGIVGYFSISGNLDSCITIRTVVIKNGKAFIQSGAGIVADSIPENEYKETQNKAMALIKAIKESSDLNGFTDR